MVKQKKRSFMSKLFSRRILLLIQFIVSIIFLGCIYILKMLPMKYYLILCGIIFLLWMLSSLLIKSGIKKRENKYARLIFGKLLSLMLSIALGFVSVMAFKGNNFLSNITGSFTQTRVICMYVKKGSAIKSLSDVKDNTEIVGVNDRMQLEMVTKILQKSLDFFKLCAKCKNIQSENWYLFKLQKGLGNKLFITLLRKAGFACRPFLGGK